MDWHPLPEIEHVRGIMRQMLREAGFDFAHPSVPTAWRIFQKLAAQRLPGLTTSQVIAHLYQAADRDQVLWLDFSRELERPDEAVGYAGCLFSVRAPESLIGIDCEIVYQAGDLSSWFTKVETNPAFITAFALSGWAWEGTGR